MTRQCRLADGSLAVIGGGVIGLSVARRAALTAGRCACTAADERGASWVAGGMLAPHSEGWPGEERLLQLGLASLALWHDGTFLDGLPADVVTARESLVVAVDRADAADLKTVGEWLAAQGHPVTPTIGRARHRTAAGAGHSARLPRRNRTGRGQSGAGRGAGGALRTARRAVGAAGGRRWPRSRRRHRGDRQRHRRARAVARPADPAGEGRGAAAALAARLYAGAAAGDPRPRARPAGVPGAARRRRGRRRHPVRARPRHRARGRPGCANCSTTRAR